MVVSVSDGYLRMRMKSSRYTNFDFVAHTVMLKNCGLLCSDIGWFFDAAVLELKIVIILIIISVVSVVLVFCYQRKGVE